MPDSSTISRSWIRLRQDLYEQVQSHVNALLGRSGKALAQYQQEYELEFRRKWKVSSRRDLLKALSKSRIVWIGDFHAVQQSQKAQLRVLKSLSPAAVAKMVLAIECVEASRQAALNNYLQGKLSEREFLKAVEWKKSWGFPWENYKPLFRWAQKHKVPMVALNLKKEKGDLRSLKERDQFSGKLIVDSALQNPDRQIFVIYGDLHLAQKHLPSVVEKVIPPEKNLFIFQNSERIYFQLLKREIEHQVDIVRLTFNRFCLLSVPPWVKWQSYLMYLEQQDDREVGGEIDFTDDIARYIRVINEDLGVDTRTDHFTLVTANDPMGWEQLEKGLQEADLKIAKIWIEAGRSFFFPQLGVAYLGRPSVNSAAQLAMAIVFAHLNKQKNLHLKMPQDFQRLIWLEAVFYFGSKLINPKRKTDALNDIKAVLQARNPYDQGKEALQLALGQKMQELLHLSGNRKQVDLMKPRQKRAYLEAARILGGMMGEKIYHAYRKKLLSRDVLLSLFRKPVEAAEFTQIYWGLLEVIENFPEPFQSKTEKM